MEPKFVRILENLDGIKKVRAFTDFEQQSIMQDVLNKHEGKTFSDAMDALAGALNKMSQDLNDALLAAAREAEARMYESEQVVDYCFIDGRRVKICASTWRIYRKYKYAAG